MSVNLGEVQPDPNIFMAGASLAGGALRWSAGTCREGFDTFFKLVQAAFLAISA